jgi:tellurite resistance protein
MTQAELSPLFSGIALSLDDAEAIGRALYDIAQSDGTHDEEIAMIKELLGGLHEDLGEADPKNLAPIDPEALARALVDPDLRKVMVQCAVLISLADGEVTDKERARSLSYASALGLGGASYDAIEKAVTEWVSSGYLEPLFD